MKYRAVTKADLPDGSCEIVLAQKMSAFDPALPAVVSIVGAIPAGSLFDTIKFPAEFELAFADHELTSVDQVPLAELLDFRFSVRIDFRYLQKAASAEADILSAEFLD